MEKKYSLLLFVNKKMNEKNTKIKEEMNLLLMLGDIFLDYLNTTKCAIDAEQSMVKKSTTARTLDEHKLTYCTWFCSICL